MSRVNKIKIAIVARQMSFFSKEMEGERFNLESDLIRDEPTIQWHQDWSNNVVKVTNLEVVKIEFRHLPFLLSSFFLQPA